MSLKRHLSYAQGYLELGLVGEAQAELDRLAEDDADKMEVLALRMAVLQEAENWTQLARVAAKVVERAPGEAGAWVTWAYATRRAKTLAAAEAILLRAERKHPHEPTIQFNLACYACLKGDFAAARRRVDRAVALDPKFLHVAATDPDLAALRNSETKSS